MTTDCTRPGKSSGGAFEIVVDADALEKVLAFIEQEDLEPMIDDDIPLRAAATLLNDSLHQFAELNPAFDIRDLPNGDE